MKLHRFKAINTQKAMQKIHEVLGREALIYSTKSTVEGVEILAGLPYAVEEFEVEATVSSDSHASSENQSISHELLSKMQQQLEQTQHQIQEIAKRINIGVTHFINNLNSIAAYQSNQMSYHLQVEGVGDIEGDNVLQIFPHIDVTPEPVIEDTLNDEEDVIKRAEVAKSNWEKNRKKRQRWG